ncbi:MFS transporter [Nocardia mangyaensis]|uniref:MFS transporter n=1 Tax=Nocardia mangyaensis TaxID=2213200 RepID=UPI002676904E|nr:MFS transporter [Nocardia mangyaensis]MDO3650357.1 MFS transporter [Nocardia mangyaensis]
MTTPRDPTGPDRGRRDGTPGGPPGRHPGFGQYPPRAAAPRKVFPRPDTPAEPPTRGIFRRHRPTDPATTPLPNTGRGGPGWTTSNRVQRDEPGRGSGPSPDRRSSPDPRIPPEPRHDGRGPTSAGPADDHGPAGTRAFTRAEETVEDPGQQRVPRKLTVTRVAAMRSRELTERGFATFQRAAKADGADQSGLTALTYATMANFALDAAIAVALANTLFFASATAESKTKVALYLLITIAPFALIAPLIGPLLDRLQRGRRLALATTFGLRAIFAVLLIFNIDTWGLYPLALCMMVGSKSFAVLKSAVTPRVLPPEIDLVRTNSRLTVFGLVGGTIGAGALAALAAVIAGSTGALVFAAGLAIAGAYLSLRIPRWVEVTEGEVPATLTYHGHDAQTEVLAPAQLSAVPPRKRRQPLGRSVVTGLWGNSSIRVLTGFLTFYVAFVAKGSGGSPTEQAAMLGVVGAAAAIGNFGGNATGARLQLGRPSLVVLGCTACCTAVAVFAVFTGNLFGAAFAALVASAGSALAKVSLDASIQDDLPPESIASGFGRSETVLQLSWVVGGSAGVLLPTEYWKGFAVISVILVLGLVQTFASYTGHSLLPGLGGNRPQHVEQEVTDTHPDRVDPGPVPRGTGDPIW